MRVIPLAMCSSLCLVGAACRRDAVHPALISAQERGGRQAGAGGGCGVADAPDVCHELRARVHRNQVTGAEFSVNMSHADRHSEN